MLLGSNLLNWCNHTSTVRADALHITSSPAPNATDLSSLSIRAVNFTTDQLFSRSTVPVVKPNERSPVDEKTAESESPHTQVETSTFNIHTDGTSQSPGGTLSLGFDDGSITPINATETSLFNFLNATMNTSAEPGFLEASATAEPSETSINPPEPQDQQFNTTSGDKDQQKEKELKWSWED